MKTVVMIAHTFPPEGSAGAYRPLRFVRHLSAQGWNATVISVAVQEYERYDPDLLQQVPTDVDVIRVASRDWWQTIQARRAQRLRHSLAATSPAAMSRLQRAERGRIRSLIRHAVRRAEAWCYQPDKAMQWIRPAVEATVSAIAQRRADTIWATAGPISSFIVAERASQRTGVPYVLDFRDAWTITDNEFDSLRPSWAITRDRRNLFRILKGAQAIVFRYHSEAECYWRAYGSAIDPSKVYIIPNGYDGEIDRQPSPASSRCTLLYTGTLYSYRFDTFIEALQKFLTEDANRARLLRVIFVGEGGRLARDATTSADARHIIEVREPLTHRGSAELHRQADALFVLGRPSSMTGYELFAGAKVFEYLKAGRPILGILPRDETRNILRRVGIATIADVESVPEIVGILQQTVDAWASGQLQSLRPDPRACAAFSAPYQTAELARALAGDPPTEPFVPGAVEVPPSLRRKVESSEWVFARSKSAGEPAAALARN
jgi:glycosyltransferase involved in cell wall biosynthesis